MLLRQFHEPRWQVNSFLVAQAPGGEALLVDAGGPLADILEACASLSVQPRWLLLTHRHPDHIAHAAELQEHFGLTVCAHADEWPGDPSNARLLSGGDRLSFAGSEVDVLAVPGHTTGHLAFHLPEVGLFTGDTLFRGSVGGCVGSGHGSFDQLQHSVMEVLLKHPQGTRIYSAHTEPSRVEQEWQCNPFVRLWRGLDPPAELACRYGERNATLELRAPDYDGGSKCQVRFDDGDRALVPGSQVR